MNCPNRHGKLEKALFNNVEVDYCLVCLGIWFEQDELEWAKDNKDKQLNWLDIDLWRDKDKFTLSKSSRQCPADRTGLMEVRYDDSHVRLDYCKFCRGIWLDRGEFHQLMVYLKKRADYQVLHHYVKNLVKELWEVFSGPQKFREELNDFFVLLKLLNYKFVVQHKLLNKMIENAQK